MRIDHLALYAHDIDRMKAFYQTYFHAQAGKPYHNPATGLRTCFLSFGEGARLELMTRPGLASEGNARLHPGYAHIAFSVGSRGRVDSLTKRLQTDGYTVLSGPRTTGDGYYESCVADPEGNQVEITE